MPTSIDLDTTVRPFGPNVTKFNMSLFQHFLSYFWPKSKGEELEFVRASAVVFKMPDDYRLQLLDQIAAFRNKFGLKTITTSDALETEGEYDSTSTLVPDGTEETESSSEATTGISVTNVCNSEYIHLSEIQYHSMTSLQMLAYFDNGNLY